MSRIYLDNHATTPLIPEVRAAMEPFWDDIHANPSSSHREGQQARRALEDAREQIADLLEALPEEVIFTSGATEANNLALFGLRGEPPGHLISSPIEHPCAREPVELSAKSGFSVSWLPVSREGIVELDPLAEMITEETRLLNLMAVNHETGAVQPIPPKLEGVDVHCDAAQAVGKIPVRFRAWGVTSLSLCAHKFHGPKGVGALLLRQGRKLKPLLMGGHQQQGRRPGTEPVALVVGMAKALELACAEMGARRGHVEKLRTRFLDILRHEVPGRVVNGPTSEARRVPHVANVSFPGLKSDALLMSLDLAGVACSTGSACSSGSLLPSPVLGAMGVPEEVLRSAMRFSFSHLLTLGDVEAAAHRIAQVARRLHDSH